MTPLAVQLWALREAEHAVTDLQLFHSTFSFEGFSILSDELAYAVAVVEQSIVKQREH